MPLDYQKIASSHKSISQTLTYLIEIVQRCQREQAELNYKVMNNVTWFYRVTKLPVMKLASRVIS